MIHEAPVHVFLQHEEAALTSFLQIALVSGWDLHLLPTAGYGQAFVSLNDYLDVTLENAIALAELESALAKMGVPRKA